MSEMTELIKLVNGLQEASSISGLSHELGLPKIVVVGGQSAGKSSVLEGFVGKDFLPRGSDIVTRRPLVLQLLQNEEEFATFLHAGDRKFVVGEEVRREIEEETQRETGGNKGVSEKEIFLRIYSPNVIDLTLIDLPGMTKVPVGGQPQDIEEQIRNMILKYIDDPNTIILAVTPANQDLANSDALAVAREVDPELDRTIGVITKLDLMDEGTDARNVLEGRLLPLKKGFIGVVNRSQAAINSQRTINDAIEQERNFFLNSPYRDIMKKHGMKYLQNFLKKELEDIIRMKLPEIKNELASKRLATEDSLEALGYKSDRGQKPFHLVAKFKEAFNQKLEGDGTHTVKDRINIGPLINRKFYNEFSRIIVNPFDKDPNLDKDIENAVVNAHGIWTPVSLPEKVLRQTAHGIISTYEPAMERCVDEIKVELEKLVEECLSEVLAGYPILMKEVQRLARGQISKCEEETLELLKKHIKAEQAFMNLRHPDFPQAFEQYAPSNAEAENPDEHQSKGKSLGKEAGKAVGGALGGAVGGAAGGMAGVGGPVASIVGEGIGKGIGATVGGVVGEKIATRGEADDDFKASTDTNKKGGFWSGMKGKKSGSKYESTQSLDSETKSSTKFPKPWRHAPGLPKSRKGEEAIRKEPEIQGEAKTVKKMLRDYIAIVHESMMDKTPKFIMFALVLALQNYVKEDLDDDLNESHPTEVEKKKLLQWEECEEVTKLLEKREAISKALETVRGFA